MAKTRTLRKKEGKWVPAEKEDHPEHSENQSVHEKPVSAVGQKRCAENDVEKLLQEVLEEDQQVRVKQPPLRKAKREGPVETSLVFFEKPRESKSVADESSVNPEDSAGDVVEVRVK